jgi:hypothetical protein
LTFLLLCTHAQVFEEKVANGSLAFEQMIDWIAFPRLFLTFLLFSAHAQVFDEKVANVSLAFELMMDGGLPQPKARPEDIVNLDLKSTLRLEINTFLSCCGSESGSTGSTCFWASWIRIH